MKWKSEYLAIACSLGISVSLYGEAPLLNADFTSRYAQLVESVRLRTDISGWFKENILAFDPRNPDSYNLCHAAMMGDLQLVRYLLSQEDIKVNIREDYGMTPLMAASRCGYCDIMEALIRAGADVNARDEWGMTALHYAAKRLDSEALNLLLASGRGGEDDPAGPVKKKSRFAFFKNKLGFHDKVRVDVDIKNKKGSTALAIAAAEGVASSVRSLVQAGADITLKDEKGNAPLLGAVLSGKTSHVMELLHSGASVNEANDLGYTPLMYAVAQGKEDIIEELLSAGAEVNRQNGEGMSALMMAVLYGRERQIDRLLEAHADVNLKMHSGATALMLASLEGNISAVQRLLAADADIDATRKDGCTAILLAAANGHVDIVTLLLKTGAEVTVDARDDLTTLVSAYQVQVELLQKLKKLQIKPEACSDEVIARILNGNEIVTVGKALATDQGKETMTRRQQFVDSAQMLTECFYVISKSGRFDLVEQLILSNVKIGKISRELKHIAEQVIELCQKGRRFVKEMEFKERQKNINVMDRAVDGLRAGTKLVAQNDPVGALMFSYELISDYQKQMLDFEVSTWESRQQWDGQLKAAMFGLRKAITEYGEQYDANLSKIIVFETMEELEHQLSKPKKSQVVFDSFCERYPDYAKFQYYAIKYGSRQWLKYFVHALTHHNAILQSDTHRTQVCTAVNYRILAMLMTAPPDMPMPVRRFWLSVLRASTKFGLQNGGHMSPFFFFSRGVINAQAQCYGLERMSQDDIWNDLCFGEQLGEGAFMLFQPLWCASWLGYDMEPRDANKLKQCLRAALKLWSPSFVMNRTAFPRKSVAQQVYDDTLKVRYDWKMDWGVFSDKLVVTNTSPFALNNVSVAAHFKLKKTGDELYEEHWCVPCLEPGESWTGKMFIKDGSDETMECKVFLRCDESEIVVPSAAQ